MGIFDKFFDTAEEALGHIEKGLPDNYESETDDDPPKKVIDVVADDAVIKPSDLAWGPVGSTWHCFVEKKHALCANTQVNVAAVSHFVRSFEHVDIAEMCCMGCVQSIMDIMSNLMKGKKP